MSSHNMRYHKPERYLWHSAKNRAKRSGISFTIQPWDIKMVTVCPLLDIPMFYEPGAGVTDNSPSLDRIDNSRGYVPGNIWVISRLANMMKSSASSDQLRTFSFNVLKHFSA